MISPLKLAKEQELLIKAIDLICDCINLNKRDDLYGVDITIYNVRQFESTLCEVFTKDGEVMTCEAIFGDALCFCWGETVVKHKAWVDSH